MITLDKINVTLGGFTLTDISFQVAAGDYFVLLGPTGAGKTVLLETIAGLNKPCSGSLYLRGTEVTRISPEDRRVSIVYQDQMLFPHMNVRDNILFGCRARGMTIQEQTETLNWLCGLMQIEHLLHRQPDTLSGGERQKAALARALSVRPDVLLLDEPLSALDQATRHEIRNELRRLHQTLNVTIIHVTHDFMEAFSMAEHVAVLAEREIKQVGTVANVFYRPTSEFVANFTMAQNVFYGHAITQNGVILFHGDGFQVVSASCVDGPCTAVIRPELISVNLESAVGAANEILGTITEVHHGLPLILLVACGDSNFTCFVYPSSDGAPPYQPGNKLFLSFPPSAVHLIH